MFGQNRHRNRRNALSKSVQCTTPKILQQIIFFLLQYYRVYLVTLRICVHLSLKKSKHVSTKSHFCMSWMKTSERMLAEGDGTLYYWRNLGITPLYICLLINSLFSSKQSSYGGFLFALHFMQRL